MKLRDVPKLRTGDIITCWCEECGCKGKEYEVRIVVLDCGCIYYKHEGNGWSFARWYKPNCGIHTPPGLYWGVDVDPHKIKLIRRAEG